MTDTISIVGKTTDGRITFEIPFPLQMSPKAMRGFSKGFAQPNPLHQPGEVSMENPILAGLITPSTSDLESVMKDIVKRVLSED